MKIKAVHLLICVQFILNFRQVSTNGNYAYQRLLERTYQSFDSKVEDNEDCGEPLLLTQYIKQNRTAEARLAAYVNSTNFLPGLDSYSGYLTVDDKHNGNLFFWYFPIMHRPVKETPLILWLQGGPGASSLFGLFEEIGPFYVTEDLKVKEKPYSWNKNHSLLFIDNPVGTGFSFTDYEGYSTNQTTIGENLYKALQQFMQIFPENRNVPLIIAGESYAGKHIPSLGIQIHRNKQNDPAINLQGLAIGNGFIDPVTLQRLSYVARETGILDDAQADDLKKIEKQIVNSINNKEIRKAFDLYMEGAYLLYSASRLQNPYNFVQDAKEMLSYYVQYLEKTQIRRALHVGNNSFSNIGQVYNKLVPDMMNSAKSWLEELLNHYRVLVYNGHLDTVVAYHPSIHTYKSLSFSDAIQYKNANREIWVINDELAGYYKQAGNFLEVMVRNAGHMVPVDQPAAALQLITAFAYNLPLNVIPDEPVMLL